MNVKTRQQAKAATENPGTEDREHDPNADRSARPVIEHALTVYFGGNADLARTLINRLIAEERTD